MRRPAHKLAHAVCPYGVFNWADCDAAASHRWGRCKAMVDAKPEPHTCTNWAVAEDGWCGQHYASAQEKAMEAARKEERKLQLDAAIDAYIERASKPDYDWWSSLRPSAESTRGLAGVPVTAVRQASSVAGHPASVAPGDGPPRPRKLPQRIVLRKGPMRLG